MVLSLPLPLKGTARTDPVGEDEGEKERTQASHPSGLQVHSAAGPGGGRGKV